jgi:hypothetical protein
MFKVGWVAKITLILEYFNPDRPTMMKWMKHLGYELGDLLDWDEYSNGKKTTIHKSEYSFSHPHLLSIFTEYSSRLLQGLKHQRSVFTLVSFK